MPCINRIILLLILFFSVASVVKTLAWSEQPAPRVPVMRRVEPPGGKQGDVLTVFGEALDKSRVRELYLTDGKNDYKLEILDQTEEAIRFRLTPKIPVGRLHLMLLTAGEPELLEEPVFVRVLEER